MDKLISVIIPAYNIEQWVGRCLDSVLSQTYQNLEIIVIDDGSTDHTPAIIDQYANKDPRVIPVHQENKGLVEVRNIGIELANGEYIAFVDGDDAIDSDMYERLLSNAIKYNADISHCGVRFCFPNGKQNLHYGTNVIKIQNTYEGLKDLLEGQIIEPGVWNKLYKSEVIKDTCMDKKILNNEDLLRNFAAFSKSKKSVFEDFCGYQYYQREGSMSKDRKRKIRIEQHITKARKLIVENSTEEIYPFAMRTWLNAIVNSINGLIFSEDAESKEYVKECIKILRKERQNLHYLIKRQQIAAKLVLISPTLYKMVYRMYLRKNGNR